MNNINEIFALPIGLQKVIIVSGIPLYGSKNLNIKFLNSINNSKRGKLIYNSVEKMVNEKKVIPCFADSGIINFFRRRISKNTSGGLLRILKIIIGAGKPIDHPLDYVLAFYDFNSGKIIVLISNHITEKFSVNISDDSISLSLTHELMHMFAHQNPSKFLSLFKDELNSYYTNYFKIIFKLKDEKSIENDIESIYSNLFLKCELPTIVSISTMLTKLKELKKYSVLNEDKFNEICIDYIKLSKVILEGDLQKFIKETKEKYKYLVIPLYKSYKLSFGRSPIKGCGQELIYPSEVICGYSDIKISSKIREAIKSLS